MQIQYVEWMNQLIANHKDKKYQYLIVCGKNNVRYFYYDFEYVGGIDTTTFQMLWTPTRKRAFSFESEQEVEEFKADYISPRKASIIRVIKRPISMIELTG